MSAAAVERAPLAPILVPKPGYVLGQELRFEYKAWGRVHSVCRVRIFKSHATERVEYPGVDGGPCSTEVSRRIVVIVSEIGEGPTVTNSIETIASQILPRAIPHSSLRDRMRWIEQFQGERGEHFDLVSFVAYDAYGPYFAKNEWGHSYSGPRWSRSCRADVLAILGSEVEL